MSEGKVQQKQQARRAEIVGAAQKCFAEKGLHGASVADIAREAGLSVGQLYRIFASKEAIIEAIVVTAKPRALHYGLMLATGLLAGLCGPLFIWLMDYSHRGFVKLKLAPPWQLALGGLIVGGLSLITPAVWGNGYSVVQSFAAAAVRCAAGGRIYLQTAGGAGQQRLRRAGGLHPDAVCRPGDGHAVCLLQQAVATGK